jgi:hypothetical protein
MGVCASDLGVESIKTCLDSIRKNEASMREAAYRYYDAENVERAVTEALNRYLNIKERNKL